MLLPRQADSVLISVRSSFQPKSISAASRVFFKIMSSLWRIRLRLPLLSAVKGQQRRPGSASPVKARTSFLPDTMYIAALKSLGKKTHSTVAVMV